MKSETLWSLQGSNYILLTVEIIKKRIENGVLFYDDKMHNIFKDIFSHAEEKQLLILFFSKVNHERLLNSKFELYNG